MINKCNRILSLIFFSAAILLIRTAPVFSDDQYNILILHSYSRDYLWTAENDDAITDKLAWLSPDSIIRSEFMDTKNFYNRDYIENLMKIYSEKYSENQPDGIIITDNNALDFIYEFGSILFPEAVAVACGINNALPPKTGTIVKSIIAENADHLETFRQGLNLLPETERIYVVSDSTTTGNLIRSEVQTALQGFEYATEFIFINNKTLNELKETISGIDDKSLIYMIPFFKTADDVVFPQKRVLQVLAEESRVPIMVSWSYQMNSGALGGCVISSKEHGELAAKTIINLLQGEGTVSFIDIMNRRNGLHTNTYDYGVLQQFSLNKKLLPEDTVFINKPGSFFEKHYQAIIPSILVLFVFLIFILLLLLNLRKQRAINSYQQEVLLLNREIIDTQHNIVTTLGDVIETRSRNTGNHVLRVCKISRLLGEKLQLSEHDLDLLEASASLHDVGKIGIPESILHKDGRLTEDEFEIIKKHTNIGGDILKNSDRELLQNSRIIALQHHERWDGTGYPAGLKGEEISLFARITMIADVYDALADERSYKKAWNLQKITDYMSSERGKAFDPHLIDIFISDIDDFDRLRKEYASIAKKS